MAPPATTPHDIITTTAAAHHPASRAGEIFFNIVSVLMGMAEVGLSARTREKGRHSNAGGLSAGNSCSKYTRVADAHGVHKCTPG
jgi:hypothetical protein